MAPDGWHRIVLFVESCKVPWGSRLAASHRAQHHYGGVPQKLAISSLQLEYQVSNLKKHEIVVDLKGWFLPVVCVHIVLFFYLQLGEFKVLLNSQNQFSKCRGSF